MFYLFYMVEQSKKYLRYSALIKIPTCLYLFYMVK